MGASVLPGLGEGMMSNFADPDTYPVEARGSAYSWAFFSAKHLGAGQYYLMTIRDKDHKPFEGSATYRLNVPANAPVKLYWSATVYDRATHALIRDQPYSSRASTTPELAEERRQLRGRLFRPQGSGGQGIELGADQRRRNVRSAVSSLRPGEGVLRQTMGAAGHRTGSIVSAMEVAVKRVGVAIVFLSAAMTAVVAQGNKPRARHGRQFRPRQIRHVFREYGQGRRVRKISASARAGHDRKPDDYPAQPGHALFVCGVRPRRRAGHHHNARRGQSLYVAHGRQ